MPDVFILLPFVHLSGRDAKDSAAQPGVESLLMRVPRTWPTVWRRVIEVADVVYPESFVEALPASDGRGME